jgi:uncharacterized protein YlxP (DUF503 family)
MAIWLLGGRPGGVSLYAARTLKSAKAIMLPVFAELNQKYQLGLIIRSVEGEVIEANGHIIRLHGLKDQAAAELLRGQHFDKVALDEAGAFSSELLKYSIESILLHTLIDRRGPLLIGGTPGPICAGYFYDLVGDPQGTGKSGRWPTHAWDLRQNPHLFGSPEENIAEILAANGWTEDHPTFRREVLAQWVDDAGALIYKYLGERWAPVPDIGRTVLSVDFAGSDKPEADSTAFVVGRQDHSHRPHVFIVEAFARHGINLGQIAETIRALKAKWNVSDVVVDAGALGAGYAKTLRENYNVGVRAADKTDKLARINLAIATLDTKTLHLCKDASALADEWQALCWDDSHRTHHERCSDDLSDALLYLLREFQVVAPPAQVIAQVGSYEDRLRAHAMRKHMPRSGL